MKSPLKEFLFVKRKSTSDVIWHSDKKMPKSGKYAMLLATKGGYRLGSGWRWCMVDIETVESGQYKLWVCYHIAKQNYMAVLGKPCKNNIILVLARLENHGTHPGWHVHGCCKEIPESAIGRTGYTELKRIPQGNSTHRNNSFPRNDGEALSVAGVHFRIQSLYGDAFQGELSL